jgi:hypothetical protein
MELTTCPQCRSKQIHEKRIKDIVINEVIINYECKVCGYQGTPLILEKYEGVFQGIKSAVPGFIGPWEILTRLDNGERKILSVLWEDARDCIRSLELKKGDRITVTIDEKIWCIDKINSSENSGK